MAFFAVTEFCWDDLHQTTITAAVLDGIRIGAIGSTLSDGQGSQLSREDSIKKTIDDKAEGIMVNDSANILIFPVDGDDFSDPDDPAVWQQLVPAEPERLCVFAQHININFSQT